MVGVASFKMALYVSVTVKRASSSILPPTVFQTSVTSTLWDLLEQALILNKTTPAEVAKVLIASDVVLSVKYSTASLSSIR